MLKTVTFFPWEHKSLMECIEDGTLPKPSMHFVTGPVKLGKEGEDEVINEVYFHTFDMDGSNEDSNKFFEAVTEFINKCAPSSIIRYEYVQEYCQFMRVRCDAMYGEILNGTVMPFTSIMQTNLMVAIAGYRRHNKQMEESDFEATPLKQRLLSIKHCGRNSINE